MDSLLAKAGELASVAQKQLEGGFDSVLDQAVGEKCLSFEDAPLGFRLEGVHVVAVDGDTQADWLGVRIGDRLAVVNDTEIPNVAVGDKEGIRRAKDLIKKTMKDAGWPVSLTFVPPALQGSADEEEESGAQQGMSKEDEDCGDAALDAGHVSLGKAEASAEGGLGQKRSSGESQHVEASAVLGGSRQGEPLTGSRELGEASTIRAPAADECRAATVPDRAFAALASEMVGMRSAHQAELDILRQEHRAECQRLQSCSEAEVAQRAEEAAKHELELSMFQGKLSEALCELEAQKKSALAAADEAEAAAVEAAGARAEAADALARAEAAEKAAQRVPAGSLDHEGSLAAPASSGAIEDVEAQRLHIAQLEHRCAALRKALEAQRAALGVEGCVSGGGQRHPAWLPWVVGMAGPKAGEVVMLTYSAMDGLLRGFTHRLLNRQAWLWVFYAHLLVLYLVVGSSLASVSVSSSASPVEALNARIDSAAALAAPAATATIPPHPP